MTRPPGPARSPSPAKRDRGTRARKDGRGGEWIAALWLMATGWRLLAMRKETPMGEIDLLARRGDVLAVIEVKRRRTVDEALAAVSAAQLQRLRRAGAWALARQPDHARLSLRLDLIALAPRRLPKHVPDAWPN